MYWAPTVCQTLHWVLGAEQWTERLPTFLPKGKEKIKNGEITYVIPAVVREGAGLACILLTAN